MQSTAVSSTTLTGSLSAHCGMPLLTAVLVEHTVHETSCCSLSMVPSMTLSWHHHTLGLVSLSVWEGKDVSFYFQTDSMGDGCCAIATCLSLWTFSLLSFIDPGCLPSWVGAGGMPVANVVMFCALVILWISCEVEAGMCESEGEIVRFIHVPSLWSEVETRGRGEGEYQCSFSLSAQK